MEILWIFSFCSNFSFGITLNHKSDHGFIGEYLIVVLACLLFLPVCLFYFVYLIIFYFCFMYLFFVSFFYLQRIFGGPGIRLNYDSFELFDFLSLWKKPYLLDIYFFRKDINLSIYLSFYVFSIEIKPSWKGKGYRISNEKLTNSTNTLSWKPQDDILADYRRQYISSCGISSCGIPCGLIKIVRVTKVQLP